MFSRTNLMVSIGFLIVIVMMTVMATLAMSGMTSIQKQLDQVVSINAEKLHHVAIMRRSNRERIIGLQLMLILEDPFEIDEIAMQHMGYANRFIAARQSLYTMATSDAELVALEKIREASMLAAPINDEIRDLALDEHQSRARALMIEKLSPVQDHIYAQFMVLAEIYKSEAKRSIETAEQHYDWVYRRTMLILAAVVGLCGIIAFQVTLRINRSERSLVEHLDELERIVEERTIELKQESERLAVTLASIGDGVVTITIDGTIKYMNPAAERLTQCSHQSVLGKPVDSVLRSVDQKTGKDRPLLSFAAENPRKIQAQGDGVIRRENGELLEIHQTVADITDEQGKTHGSVVILRDVSEARAFERRLAHEATHDPMTGLVNRREFESRAEHIISQALVDHSFHTLCYLDLDRFKAVNDSCGHAVGDRLLRELSDRVCEKLRKIDTFARLGGDEFGLLLEQCPVSKGQEVAESIRKMITDLEIIHEDQVFSVGVSMGVVEINADSSNLETLLSIADTACYAAKESGGGSVQVYRPTDNDVIHRQGQTHWARKLRRALDENAFELYCQPIRGVANNFVQECHYEVLMRLRNENNELVLPGEFLPSAERYSLMMPIDQCVITKALSWIGLNASLLAQSRFAINIAGDSLSDPIFLRFVTSAFEKTGANPKHVIFEITENVAITNLTAAIKFMDTLNRLGCEFALDDFGQGFSSLGSLKNLPVDYLKIDGGFVRGILDDSEDEAMVIAINEIGHALGKRTVAEFVEDDAILERVTRLGVDFAQGFGIAKPQPINEVFGLT